MASVEQLDGVVSKEKTRHLTVGSNGSQPGKHESATKRVGLQQLPTSSPSVNTVVDVQNEMMPPPSRKRIRLSLKGKTMATVSLIPSHDHTPVQLHGSAPPSNHGEKAVKLDHDIDEANSTAPPKKKIKLVLSKIGKRPKAKEPLSCDESRAFPRQLDRNIRVGTNSIEASVDAAEAMVLENGAEGEDDAVAAVVEEPPKALSRIKPMIALTPQKDFGPNDHYSFTSQKVYSAADLRSVRMPPMSSPGLLVPPGIYRGPIDSNGLVSPNAIFIDAMTTAGYTLDSRTNDPHRGSSIQRVVDDMYDSNVKLCLNFPELVPRKYLEVRESDAKSIEDDARVAKDATSESHENNAVTTWTNHKKPNKKHVVAERLIKALEVGVNREDNSERINWQRQGQKRRRVRSFTDLVPVSLTLPYPEEYILKRLDYLTLVDERERKIIARQEDKEKMEMQKEQFEFLGEEYSVPTTSEITVPPIPIPPDPPYLHAMQGMESELYCNDEHPFYRSKAELVEHLDRRCFHITDGRYFGLSSCGLADQHFVGPNAPGINGLHLSSVSGLATSNTGGSNGGVPLFDPPSTLTGPKTSMALGIVSAKTNVKPSPVKSQKSGSGKKSNEPKDQKPPATNDTTTEAPKNSSSVPSTKNGPTVTATKHQLKLIMEGGGEEAEKMRMVIIKAAVHALRAGKYENRSFRGFDRKVYPDVSKAFSVHSGLKPCTKCKSNKQGTYHCRFRRRHHFPDFDGCDSWKVLEPLFEAPLGDLIIKPLKKKEIPEGSL
jgi:hypothetical protein